ncbi:hypothetical protein [Erythrobacter sp. SD-21]|uniref:hypothetical protein n=1 Tax=Erythrobacter sp. SD-21 TaxID=161528 RepID=UPI000153F92E|nr:hypothetical protein [Erythrobacter sp. SD-21]EDL49955.1 hypothetical protein ED21_25828 [Erythrobacter sp. SD-21]
MIGRAASSWQTITADLALILFLVTAQAAGPDPENIAGEVSERQSSLVGTTAVAVHRPYRGEPVGEWFASTVVDPRQIVTISIYYTPHLLPEALEEGQRLLDEADAAGITARLMMMKGSVDTTVLSVEYLRAEEDGTDIAL